MECYSVTMNNSGTKLALGGLDGKVRIWDVASILRFKDHTTQEDAQSRNLLDRLKLHSLATILRPLASVSRHNGVVASVKFSPDGRFIASGSDDKIILIWEKDDDLANRPKQFGEAEPDMEHWTVRKRLVAHDNDVQDICWSPDGSLLITVGLDRSIIIWSGTTFERIKRYDIHQSMVKGVVFDPANKFFATASDDRTVRIFRFYRKHDGLGSYEFQMEQIVFEPFLKSPLTSYFRRMSWSPDGQHIAIPNATNGPVTSVVIVNRGNWASDVSLIGHEAPCEVCAFSPRLFRLKDSKDYTTILALAGQDRTLAIWSTALLKPLVVLHDITMRPITDLSWTPDGQTLFLSSLDGLITCVTFDENELGEVVSENAIDTQLLRYGGDQDSKIMPESVSQLKLEALAKSLDRPPKVEDIIPKASIKEPVLNAKEDSVVAPLSSSNAVARTPDKVTLNTATVKGGKKRVAPTLVSKYTLLHETAAKVVKVKKFDISSKLSQTSYLLPRLGVQTAVHGLSLRLMARSDQEKKKGDDNDNDNEDMGIDETANQLQTAPTVGHRAKQRKFRRYIMLRKYPTAFKKISSLPDEFFSNQAVMNHEISKLILNQELLRQNPELVNTTSLDSIEENIYFQVVTTSMNNFVEPNEIVGESKHVVSTIEIRNGPAWPETEELQCSDYAQRLDFVDPTQVSVVNDVEDEKRSYMLYFPYRIQQVVPVMRAETLSHYALISFDGTVQIIRAYTGAYACPGLELGSNVVAWRQREGKLLFLTSAGLLYCWELSPEKDLQNEVRPILNGVSLAPVLNAESTISRVEVFSRGKGESSENTDGGDKDGKKNDTDKKSNDPKQQFEYQAVIDNVSLLEIDELGIPYVMIERTCAIYSYNKELAVWTKVVDPWLFAGDAFKPFCDKRAGKFALIHKSYNAFKEKVGRGERGKCTFDNTTEELSTCIDKRLNDQMRFYKYC